MKRADNLLMEISKERIKFMYQGALLCEVILIFEGIDGGFVTSNFSWFCLKKKSNTLINVMKVKTDLFDIFVRWTEFNVLLMEYEHSIHSYLPGHCWRQEILSTALESATTHCLSCILN